MPHSTARALARTRVLLLLVALFLYAPIASADVSCLVSGFSSTPPSWPDYGSSNPVVTPSCTGTNNQTIDQLDRVVFLGDSLAVGTPPSTGLEFFRSRLADQLVVEYGLAAPSAVLWKNVNVITGMTVQPESGDFASCAAWGARTDDLLGGGMQIDACFQPSTLSERTLVVIAVGGNDYALLATDQAGGATPAQLQATLDAAMTELRNAIEWLKTPGRFPNGVFVVIATPLDFTDGSGDVSSCPAAAGSGIDSFTPVLDLIAQGNETILDIAEDNGVEVVFTRERLCGHGWDSADPTAPCYRGPGNANWFDGSCVHPNPTGHANIADDVFDVITTAAPVAAVPALAPIALGVLTAGLGGLGVRRLLRGRRADG